MSYLFGNAYRGFKWTVSGIGGLSGAGGIVYGAATGGTGAVIVGSLLATQSLIFYVDYYRTSRDLDQYIGEQRSVWNTQKNELNSLIGEYRREHENFLNVVGQSAQQIATLKSLQSDMKEQHAIETEQYRQQLNEVKKRLEILSGLEERYRAQNTALSASLHSATEQSRALQVQNEELKATEEALKSQVLKLRDLHEQSKQLLKNLVLAGDTFTTFGEQFGTAANRLESTSDRVKENVDDLQDTLALLKDVATHLHTEHVRSLGSAFEQPIDTISNSTRQSSATSSMEEATSDIEQYFDDEKEEEDEEELSEKEKDTKIDNAEISWIPEWANRALYTQREQKGSQ